MYFTVKVLISAIIIATVTKLSEKTTIGGALLKSIPLTSFLVFFFMKYEGRTNREISQMSKDIVYLVIPSLILFVVFPMLLDRGWNFGVSLAISTVIMCGGYLITLKIMT
jgi:asparagine N-glycosylation enzyme membrane subunit Stt3